MYNLGENIRNYRLKKGMTTEELAKVMNVSVGIVESWERGNTGDLFSKEIVKLAIVLDTTPHFLSFGIEFWEL